MVEASPDFEHDPFPGEPKILFIGPVDSSHTHSWIGLLEGEALNVRLFALPTALPPATWRSVKTYVSSNQKGPTDPATQLRLYSPPPPSPPLLWRAFRKIARKMGAKWAQLPIQPTPEEWLADIVRAWQPDIIHTLGLDPAGYFYLRARKRFDLAGIGRWVLQTRGGSDLFLTHRDPALVPQIAEALQTCDQLLSDNRQNYRIGRELGLRDEQVTPLGTVPGTGGIDVEALASTWESPTSQRRLIVWPKAYTTPWTVALPVLEAIRLAFEQLPPCEFHVLAASSEVRAWYWTLPGALRACCTLYGGIPRSDALALMARARVLLSPSLVDGVPNSLYEAMATGAFPIVSPLETIVSVVAHEKNVLFARNLYPEEIAAALVRAMTDDSLVDGAAARNLDLVRHVANRETLRPRVIAFYRELAR